MKGTAAQTDWLQHTLHKAGDEGSLQASQSEKGGEGHIRVGSRRYNKRRGNDKVCAGRHREIQEVKTCEVRRSHRCGHSVCSVIDLVFVGVQAFGSVQVVTEVLGCFLHCFQLAGVRSGPSKECPLCEGKQICNHCNFAAKIYCGTLYSEYKTTFYTNIKSSFRKFESHLFIIFIVIIIHEMNGTVSVQSFAVPRVIRHVVHQALQGSTASKTIRDCTCSQ